MTVLNKAVTPDIWHGSGSDNGPSVCVILIVLIKPQFYDNCYTTDSIEPAFAVSEGLPRCPPRQETRETWVLSPRGEDLLEEEMATRSSILAWRLPWTEEPAGYSPWGHKESDMT